MDALKEHHDDQDLFSRPSGCGHCCVQTTVARSQEQPALEKVEMKNVWSNCPEAGRQSSSPHSTGSETKKTQLLGVQLLWAQEDRGAATLTALGPGVS